MSSEVYSYIYEKFINDGALDIYTQSIYMKKNRPAIKLCILCKEDDLNKFIDLMILQTSTFGIRYSKYNRVTLDRKFTKIETEYGININKLDKGCLIFNVDGEFGFSILTIDNSSKGTEAQYWINDFLHIRQRKDNFNQTQNILSLCKSFVSQLPSENGKIEKATYMNRSVEALKEGSVNINTFAEQVFETPKLVSEFKQYKENYQRERDIEIDDTFETESAAIKRRATGTMTTIKLDKNFDINIHGGEQYIVRGYDEEKKMYYYQLFFKEEK